MLFEPTLTKPKAPLSASLEPSPRVILNVFAAIIVPPFPATYTPTPSFPAFILPDSRCPFPLSV